MNFEYQQRIALVQLDYEHSLKLIDGIVRTSSILRQIAITSAITLIGLAFINKSSWFAIAAVTLTLLYGFFDAYHGWLYSTVLNRVKQMEKIFEAQFSAEGRSYDPLLAKRFEDSLDQFRIGTMTRLPKFQVKFLLEAKPWIMYLIYPILLITGIVAAVLCS
jgi:hypothetical protein